MPLSLDLVSLVVDILVGEIHIVAYISKNAEKANYKNTGVDSELMKPLD